VITEPTPKNRAGSASGAAAAVFVATRDAFPESPPELNTALDGAKARFIKMPRETARGA
jgi:hypothetical protein